MKKFSLLLAMLMLASLMLTACGQSASSSAASESQPAESTSESASAEPEEEDEENYKTGDAALDNPRNQDEIGEKELLVVSFGTSFNDSRRLTIGAIESALEKAFPEYAVRRGFTSQIIIDHVAKRDGEIIDNMQEALDRAVDNGVKTLVVQPTHLMNGLEYEEMSKAIAQYSDAFEQISIGQPLLTSDEDFQAVAKAITEATADYDDGETAIVFMGHGTAHVAKVSYSQMQTQMKTLGYDNVFIGTVEGEPEDTACDAVIEKVKEAGYTKVILRPLMVVAGDHANNDMAGAEDDSWLSQFNAADCFESVDTQIAGLGEIGDIQQLYVDHAGAAIDSLNG